MSNLERESTIEEILGRIMDGLADNQEDCSVFTQCAFVELYYDRLESLLMAKANIVHN